MGSRGVAIAVAVGSFVAAAAGGITSGCESAPGAAFVTSAGARAGRPAPPEARVDSPRTQGMSLREERLGPLLAHITGGEDRRGGGNGPVVVLLHGFGAPGNDLVALHRQLDVAREVRFVFPEAPVDLGAVAGGGYAGGRAWWMIDIGALESAARGASRPDRSKSVPDGLAEARAQVTALLREVQTKLGAPMEKVVLGGFSQGAMLALDVALRASQPPAGLVLMSGTIVAEDEWTPLLPKLRGLPVLQSHGRTDPLLPFSTATRLRDLLKGAGADARFIEFAGGHTIPGSVLDELAALVRRRFPRAVGGD